MSNNSNNNNRANGGGGNKVKDLINDIEKGMREDDDDNDEQEVDHYPSLSSFDNQPPSPLPAPTAPRLSNTIINCSGTNEVVPVDDNDREELRDINNEVEPSDQLPPAYEDIETPSHQVHRHLQQADGAPPSAPALVSAVEEAVDNNDLR